jgi:preprotein translocase subunit SecD
VLTDNRDIKSAENLLIHKGALAFYETYNRKSLSELLQSDNHLFSLLKVDNDSVAKIGCIAATEVEKINDYLNTLVPGKKCKFAWSEHLNNSDVCLYALKTFGNKGALVTGTDIESVKYNQDKASKSNEIEIDLKKSSVELWADATKRNLNNAIAIVLDNEVIAAPIVRSEIDGGHCMITGDYTPTEAKYIAALGNNGELPVSFKIVK